MTPVLKRSVALAAAVSGALLGSSCTIFPPPEPGPPPFVENQQNRYGYGGTQSPNYSEPRQAPPPSEKKTGQRDIKRNSTDNINIEPPPPRNKPSNPPPDEPSSAGNTAPQNDPPVSKPVPREDLPYGIPAVNRPGYVYSPYAEDKGLVDVGEMKRGTRVACPYTGKHFRVP